MALPRIVLEKAPTGLDVLFEEAAKVAAQYADPEYQIRKQESDARIRFQNQKEDREQALLQLEQNKDLREDRYTNIQIENEKNKAGREETKFNNDVLSKKREQNLDDFSLVYNEENAGTMDGIAIAESWLSTAKNLTPNTLNAITKKIETDKESLRRKNEITDNLGNELALMLPSYTYDGTQRSRDFVNANADIMLKNAVSTKYLGSMSPNVQAMYKQDMSDLSNLIKYGFEYMNNNEERQKFYLQTLAPAYENLMEQYGDYDVGAPAVEGLLRNAGYEFKGENIDLETIKKIETGEGEAVIEDIDPDKVKTGFLSFLLDPEGTKEVIKSKPGQAKRLRDELSKLNRLQSNRPVIMAGEPIPSTKKESKYQEQRSKLINDIAGKYDPNTQRFTDPNFEKAFNRMVGDNKELYYSLLQDMFPVGSTVVRNLDIDDPKAYEGGEDISPAKASGDPVEFYRRLPFGRNPFE
tara:strand:- start:406 stop:1809 length:1404 start_codon:yes stop_codon:yes gene_type:complete